MRIVIFGATGMVGQAALRESLLAPNADEVVTVGRTATASEHPKHRALVVKDLFDLSGLEDELTGLDACFFCIGVTSAGMSETDYTRVTHDLTLRVAQTLVRINPGMTFVYISGSGTDSSERGRSMWARVKGRTENELLRMPFRAAYMFRPGFIVPLDGIESKTRSYRVFYAVLKPMMPVFHRLFPRSVLTTREIGQAMLIAAQQADEKRIMKRIMETGDIRAMLDEYRP